MDVITRAEYNADMASIKGILNDFKVDLLDAIETKTIDAQRSLVMHAVTPRELADAKNEILATTRRNLVDTTVPLSTKAELVAVRSEVASVKSEMEQGFEKMSLRLDAMEHKINTIVIDGFTSLREMMVSFTTEMRGNVKHHEERLDRCDADLYNLRQSGVLQQ
jgi:hypothetical protein